MIKKLIKKILIIIGLRKENDVLLIGTPNHNNIGDSKIAIAEKNFLRANKINFFEITAGEYTEFKNSILKNNKCPVILLHGGGNIGNQYMPEEKVRRDVIKSFPDKKIIILPQTIFFSKDENGTKELQNTVNIYNKHKKLFLCIREKYSYDEYSKMFKNTILIPDMVLWEKREKHNNKNGKVLFVLRNDEERKVNDEIIDGLKEILKKNSFEFDVSDMVSISPIKKYNREKTVNKKLSEISKYSLVITDRLHGMVFSYLMHTNCIALGNYNGKVKGTYNWISSDDSICYVDDTKDIDWNLIKKQINSPVSDFEVDRKKYDGLLKMIRGNLNEHIDVR